MALSSSCKQLNLRQCLFTQAETQATEHEHRGSNKSLEQEDPGLSKPPQQPSLLTLKEGVSCSSKQPRQCPLTLYFASMSNSCAAACSATERAADDPSAVERQDNCDLSVFRKGRKQSLNHALSKRLEASPKTDLKHKLAAVAPNYKSESGSTTTPAAKEVVSVNNGRRADLSLEQQQEEIEREARTEHHTDDIDTAGEQNENTSVTAEGENKDEGHHTQEVQSNIYSCSDSLLRCSSDKREHGEHQQLIQQTDYELMRAENIRKNQEMLLALGLASPVTSMLTSQATSHSTSEQRKRPAKKRRSLLSSSGKGSQRDQVKRQCRYQLRSRKTPEGNSTTDAQLQEVDEKFESGGVEELQFDESSVFHYVCHAVKSDAMPSDNGTAPMTSSEGSVIGFHELPVCLHDAHLPKAYSLDFQRLANNNTGSGRQQLEYLSSVHLIAAGGHGGWVSLFGLGKDHPALSTEETACVNEPLLSFRAHRGWVSTVKFLSSHRLTPSSESMPLLITASNDSTVALWDISQNAYQASGSKHVIAKCLLQAAEVHASGIFSLDEKDAMLLTGSKDKTVKISMLTPSGQMKVLSSFEHHAAVVKCVEFKNANVFASCGNDRLIAVVDRREPPTAHPSIFIEDAYPLACNFVTWNLFNEHLLASSSFSPFLRLFDIRQPATALFEFSGHMNPSILRAKGLYRPAFVDNGHALVTGGER